MIDLTVIFIDRKLKLYTVFTGQKQKDWTEREKEWNTQRYEFHSFGGSRKNIQAEKLVNHLQKYRFKENKKEVDFDKVFTRIKD